MKNKVCIILKGCKSLAGSIEHNRKHKELDYVRKDLAITTAENPEVEKLTSVELHQYERLEIQKNEDNIKEKTGRKSQVKNHFIDGLISFGRDQYKALTEEEQENLINDCCAHVQHLAENNNLKIYHLSMHEDEGYYDENETWQENPHFQFCFNNVNEKTGKAFLSRLTKQDFKNLQTNIAKVCEKYGFERGTDYSAENKQAPKQVYWKDYKRQQEQLTKTILQDNISVLKQENKDLKTQLAEMEKTYQLDRQTLKDSKVAKQSDYQKLKLEFEDAKKNLNSQIIKGLAGATNSGYTDGIEATIEVNPKTFFGKEINRPLKNDVTISKNQRIPANLAKSIENTLTLKQKIEEITIEKEVIIEVEKEVITERIRYVDTPVERPVITDVDVNSELRRKLFDAESELQKAQNSNTQLNLASIEKHQLELKKVQEEKKAIEKTLEAKKIEIETLETDKTTLKTQRDTLINEKIELVDTNAKLKIENKTLSTAIERFLNLSPVKLLSDATKSIVERLNSICTNIPFLEKVENIEKNKLLANPTNANLLNYYAKINPEFNNCS